MPWFRDPKDGCGQQLAFFNTSFSAGGGEPRGVIGDVYVSTPFLPSTTHFQDVHGVAVTYAWLENNFVACESLKGL
jgi:hypothetical protein